MLKQLYQYSFKYDMIMIKLMIKQTKKEEK